MSKNSNGVGSDGQTQPNWIEQSRGVRASDIYGRVTQRIIEIMEQGVVPWRSPILGSGKAGFPTSLTSNKPYRGANVFLLACTAFFEGYSSAYWLTYQQAKERGGTVRRGERATMVVFFKMHEVTNKDTGEVKKVPVLRHYNVFNVDQCENIQAPDVAKDLKREFNPIDAAEALCNNYPDGPTMQHFGRQAFYIPSDDIVRLPDPSWFRSEADYYATRFHELAHSTGHSKRLNRGIDKDLRPFGSEDYSKEELIAEMAAAFLCAECHIEPAVIENQAAYVKGWLGKLKADAKLVIQAAGAAQRAAEWIRGTYPQKPNSEAIATPEQETEM